MRQNRTTASSDDLADDTLPIYTNLVKPRHAHDDEADNIVEDIESRPFNQTPLSGESNNLHTRHHHGEEEEGLGERLSRIYMNQAPLSHEKLKVSSKIKKYTTTVTSIMAYAFCSISMVLSNKMLASQFPDVRNCPTILVLTQCCVALLLDEFCKAFGFVTYPDFSPATAKQWLPLNVLFVSMLFTSFMALRYLSVPMFTVSKNFANIFTVLGDWYFHGNTPTMGIFFSFSLMISGALFAAYSDLQYSAIGYFWILMNCFSTSGYVLYMRHVTQKVELPKFGMVFYNNLLSIPLLIPLVFFRNEHHYLTLPAFYQVTFMSLNIFAGAIGFMLNLTSLWCVAKTSATTYAVIGSLNKVPIVIFGLIVFGVPVTVKGAVFISMALSGGLVYTYCNIMHT